MPLKDGVGLGVLGEAVLRARVGKEALLLIPKRVGSAGQFFRATSIELGHLRFTEGAPRPWRHSSGSR